MPAHACGPRTTPLRKNVARVEAAVGRRVVQASGGPFLFGAFCAADAFFAPVCTRLWSPTRCRSRPLHARLRRTACWLRQAWQRFMAEARTEADFLDFDEPYRKGR